MSENHVAIKDKLKLKAPEETQPNGMPDAPDDALSREIYAEQVRQTVRRMRPGKFTARRSKVVTMTLCDEDGNDINVQLKLQSISDKDRKDIYEKHEELVVYLQPLFGGDTPLVEEMESPTTQSYVRKWNIERDEIRYLKILHAIKEMKFGDDEWESFQLFDQYDKIVWDSKDKYAQDKVAAIQALRDMEFTNEDINMLVEEIDILSSQTTREASTELQKK